MKIRAAWHRYTTISCCRTVCMTTRLRTPARSERILDPQALTQQFENITFQTTSTTSSDTFTRGEIAQFLTTFYLMLRSVLTGPMLQPQRLTSIPISAWSQLRGDSRWLRASKMRHLRAERLIRTGLFMTCQAPQRWMRPFQTITQSTSHWIGTTATTVAASLFHC